VSSNYRTPPRPSDVNYDEARVAPYELPQALVCDDSTIVASPELWKERRRGELLEHFRRSVYGRTPVHATLEVREHSRNERALGGLATALELDVSVGFESRGTPSLSFELLVFFPNREGSHPAFLGLNFSGNHGIHPAPEVRLTNSWVPQFPELGLEGHRAVESSRGLHAGGWPLEFLVSRGYAVATLYAGDIEPDFPEGARAGLLRRTAGVAASETSGSIAAWAFGLCRALDALERVDKVDARRVAVIGHSRLGKAALWAGAQESRFALVFANGTGRGGAALSRRRLGETVRDLNQRFPHWFCANFHRFSEREQDLLVDQHELLALIAPRPLYIADAALDLWADPHGSLLACLAANPVYELLGKRGLDAVDTSSLPLGRSFGSRIGYHRRPGPHDLAKVDWWHVVAFADRWFKNYVG
jgi:hypothetical protein